MISKHTTDVGAIRRYIIDNGRN